MINENNTPFTDRSGGLKAFGVVLIILGAFNLMMAPAFLLISIMGRTMNPGQSTGYWVFSLLVNLLTFLFLGGIFLWTGIDSFRIRRWIRPILLSVGWIWLLVGLINTAVIFFMVPGLIGNYIPQDIPTQGNIVGIVIAVMGFISFVFMILLPGLLVWFYSQGSVKLTLETKDPGPSWTDACPASVLALSLFYGVSAVLTLLTSFLGVSFIFGKIITGFTSTAIMIFFALICFYICYGLYKLKIITWWLAVISTLIWTFSFIFPFKPDDVVRMISMTQGDMDSGSMAFMVQYISKYQLPIMIISAVTLIGYLMYIKKHFKRA
jgi:hypothetical protein